MSNTPTVRTLALLREHYPLVEVVERWNMHTRTRHDLFGFVDVLAVGNGRTVAVQTTSRKNSSARVRKIRDEHGERLAELKRAGWVVLVHGWDQPRGPRTAWRLRVVEL